ncbi:LysR family transcriptional regulator [Amycolatopsis jejuensis]|uniref:LysR substrate-binding domain-containing protein n=1 Tax=Amycolatopsis jejuensis TaxID=330084 RepID=UPI0005274AD2|nr:LysR family transcriptional regulator [Amycolatopsis jejuensis]
MDVRHLRYFVAIVEHNGFTRAAAALRIAQPSLSHAIRTLETELGVPLFHRAGRRILLTTAGESLLGPARRVLADFTAIETVTASMRDLTAGRLTVTAPPSIAVHSLVPWIGAFVREYPAISVEFLEAPDSNRAAARVRRAEADLGVLEALRADAELVQYRCPPIELFVALPPGSVIGEGETVRFAELADVPFVAGRPGTRVRSVLDDAVGRYGLRVAVATEERETVVPLVVSGVGAAVVPAPFARDAALHGAVVRKLDPPVDLPVQLVHRAAGSMTPAAAAFLELALRAEAGPAEP